MLKPWDGGEWKDKDMDKKFLGWAAWFIFLIILDFSVPFLCFKHVPKVTGSFLFWVTWILVAIVSMFLIFLKWNEPPEITKGNDHE